jgi:hypothetical protein
VTPIAWPSECVNAAELQRIAKLFDDWGPEVRDGASVEPHGATRWRV